MKMASENLKLKDEIVRTLSQTEKETSFEEVYKGVRSVCETDYPREEFNKVVGELVNLGTINHRNTLVYKDVTDVSSDYNDEQENRAGPSDCYGRNARGRRRRARGSRRRRSQSRKRKRSQSRGSRSHKKTK